MGIYPDTSLLSRFEKLTTQRPHGTGRFAYIYYHCRLDVGKYTIHGASGIPNCKPFQNHQLEPRSRLHPKIKTLPFYADGRLLFAAIKKCLARLWSLFFLDVFKSGQDISYQDLFLFGGLKTELLNVSFVMVYY